jgi:hypothetical protein
MRVELRKGAVYQLYTAKANDRETLKIIYNKEIRGCRKEDKRAKSFGFLWRWFIHQS